MNAQIIEIIRNSAAVPSVPQVVTRVLQIMQDSDFDYGNVVKALSADAGAASEILRLSNSALFGVRQKVVSLRQALTLLGPKRTRSLLLGRYLVDTMGTRSVEALDMSYFWRRSLSCSVVASSLAAAVAPRLREEAFISALLADIGITILAQAIPTRYSTIAEQFSPHGRRTEAQQELDAIDATHGEVSAMVLQHWSLPETITTAVNLHQSSNPGEGDSATIARIINASDRLAKLLCEIPDVEEVAAVCGEATELIGVEPEVLADLLSTVERDIEELAEILRIDVIQSNVYSLIAKTVRESLSETAPSS